MDATKGFDLLDRRRPGGDANYPPARTKDDLLVRKWKNTNQKAGQGGTAFKHWSRAQSELKGPPANTRTTYSPAD